MSYKNTKETEQRKCIKLSIIQTALKSFIYKKSNLKKIQEELFQAKERDEDSRETVK